MKVERASYAGKPLSHTVMYITKKVGHLITNLDSVEGCLVFAENGVDVPEHISAANEIVKTATPQRDYASYVQKIDEEITRRNRYRKYTLTPEGYYVGENVTIGEGAYIEPGCFIDHDVVIGKNALLKSGARIRKALIGDYFVACENCCVGMNGFTMTDDENGNKIRIPTLGRVIIGNCVEINSFVNVSCGSAGNTVISDYVKIDSFSYVGHDVSIGKNTEIAAGSVIGGFVTLGEGTYIGINATLRNRITIGEKAFIGMGAVVTKNIQAGITVVGNPARPFCKE